MEYFEYASGHFIKLDQVEEIVVQENSFMLRTISGREIRGTCNILTPMLEEFCRNKQLKMA